MAGGGDAGCEGSGRRNYLVFIAMFLASLACTVGLWEPTVARAQVINAHVFDPTASLVGGCAKSQADEVPDPGPCPGAAGVDHPPKPFEAGTCGVTADTHGDIYVAASSEVQGTDPHIDIFDPSGHYISEFPVEGRPCSLAVDSEGNLYVAETGSGLERTVLYEPATYNPAAQEIEYSGPQPNKVLEGFNRGGGGLAVDPANDHLVAYVAAKHLEEYESAAVGAGLIRELNVQPEGIEGNGWPAIAVDAQSGDIYITGRPSGEHTASTRIFILDHDGHLLRELDGPPGTATEEFSSSNPQVAIDQSDGDLYVSDLAVNRAIYQFRVFANHETGELVPGEPEFIGQTKYQNFLQEARPSGLAFVNAYDSNHGYLYVNSGRTTNATHLFAFAPLAMSPPAVSRVAARRVGYSEALLEGDVDPNNVATDFRFEYATAAAFAEEGWRGATVAPAGGGSAGYGDSPVAVSARIHSLLPGTEYRLRLVVESECDAGEEETCVAEEEASFTTLAASLGGLPDGRAYELVTPPGTNGRIPTASIFGSVVAGASISGFKTALFSAAGESLMFGVEGGSLPGLAGGGVYDTYRAVRHPAAGWRTEFTGLTGSEAASSAAGGVAADHAYAFFGAGGGGSLAAGSYLHGPGGSVQPVGIGGLGVDLGASGRWIAPGGSHVIFSGNVRLEPQAPPGGTTGIYDRDAAGGPTRVISLLPDDKPLQAGEDAVYQGASADGTAIAFKVGDTLYERRDDAETLTVASGSPTFAGISAHGARIAYLQSEAFVGDQIPAGSISVFDATTGKSRHVTATGSEAVVVNVSADGSHVYFVSPRQLDGSKGMAGEDNLYVWDGSTTRFVATLAPEDVTGESRGAEGSTGGLGLWVTQAVGVRQERYVGPGSDPSRSTSNGAVLVFESRANLKPGYDSAGHREVYRYDAADATLDCLSCNPTGAPATGDARLQSRYAVLLNSLPPVSEIAPTENLTTSGARVFFQSEEQLVAGDADETTDVYEWEAEGEGSCGRPGGCLFLISSGHSAEPNYLYAGSPDGDDVFFLTTDTLLPSDLDGTPSIYDARVGGGFPASEAESSCSEDACQGSLPFAAPASAPGSSTLMGPNDRIPKHAGRHCPRGRYAMKKKGKRRCVRRHRKRTHHGHHRRHRSPRLAGKAKRADIHRDGSKAR